MGSRTLMQKISMILFSNNIWVKSKDAHAPPRADPRAFDIFNFFFGQFPHHAGPFFGQMPPSLGIC